MSCPMMMSPNLAGGASGTTPVASWTDDNPNPTQGEFIAFTDTSSNMPSSWAWYVNDVLFSTQKNPSYFCTNPGNFTFKLTASNSFGSDSHSEPFVISPQT